MARKSKKKVKGLSEYAYLAKDKKSISKDKHPGVNYPNWPFPVAKNPGKEMKAFLGPLPKPQRKWYEKLRKMKIKELPDALF